MAATDHPDAGQVAVLGQGTTCHRIVRVTVDRLGLRDVAACGASSYHPRIVSGPPDCPRCLNKESDSVG